MIKILSKLLPYLLISLKFLKEYKGLFLSYFLVKLTEFLISFIIKAENVGFAKMIKFIYFFLSGINLILSLIVIFNLSSLDYQLPLIHFIIDIFKFIIPLMITDTINQLIEDLGTNYKQIFKHFINWVYTPQTISSFSKIEDKIENSIPVAHSLAKGLEEELQKQGGKIDLFQCNFSPDDKEYIEEYINSKEEVNWKTIAFFAFLAIGISYYMYPDLYHNIYNGIKDSLFPDRGGSDGGLGTEETVSIHSFTNKKDPSHVFSKAELYDAHISLIKTKIAHIMESDATIDKKKDRILHLYKAVTLTSTDTEMVNIVKLFNAHTDKLNQIFSYKLETYSHPISPIIPTHISPDFSKDLK